VLFFYDYYCLSNVIEVLFCIVFTLICEENFFLVEGFPPIFHKSPRPFKFVTLVPIQMVLPHSPNPHMGESEFFKSQFEFLRLSSTFSTQYYTITKEKFVLVFVVLSMKYNQCYIIVDYVIIKDTKGYKSVISD
jgi:hypothetical protein